MLRTPLLALGQILSLLACVNYAASGLLAAAPPACEMVIDEADLVAAKKSAPQPDTLFSYAGQAGLEHKIFVFRPAWDGPDRELPGLVLFHGGGWNEGKAEQFNRQARFLADRGYVVFLPEYGLSSDGMTPRDSMQDAATAWLAIRKQAPTYNLALDQLSAGGGSAGGHLAATLAMSTPLREPASLPKPRSLILFNPVIDNGPDGYGYQRVAAYWKDFSPVDNIASDHPDTLIMVGDQDDYVPVTTAQRYCSLVSQTGAACDLFVDPGQKHSWFNGKGFETTLSLTTRFLDQRFHSPDSCH